MLFNISLKLYLFVIYFHYESMGHSLNNDIQYTHEWDLKSYKIQAITKTSIKYKNIFHRYQPLGHILYVPVVEATLCVDSLLTLNIIYLYKNVFNNTALSGWEVTLNQTYFWVD